MDGIFGYKAFNNNLINRYNKQFEVGKRYKNSEYHFCKNLEDTLVFYREDDIVICEVIGSGNIIEYYNDYYSLYDVYASSEIEIIRIVNRDEIIKMFLNSNNYNRVIRFVSLYKLTKEEISLFKKAFYNNEDILNAISYYQEGDIKVYERRYSNG